MVKRLRIFAGPNGSGKSTFIAKVIGDATFNKFKLHNYVNADDIEVKLNKDKGFSFNDYNIQITTTEIQNYFKLSKFSPLKLDNPMLWENFVVENNLLHISQSLPVNSYIAADLAEFIRQNLLKNNLSFSYETVMSDSRKLDFLSLAKANGYKIYLYYFATVDPEININRVALRVAENGHNVPSEIIRKRYYSSLSNLKRCIQLSNSAFLFDNSQASILISTISSGKYVTLENEKIVPNWFEQYVLQ